MSTVIVSQADQAAASAAPPTVTTTISTEPAQAAPTVKETTKEKVEDWLSFLIQAIIPIGGSIASLWIHNPVSQHKLAVVVGESSVISQMAAAVLPTAPIQ